MRLSISLLTTAAILITSSVAVSEGPPSEEQMNRMIVGLILGNKHGVDESGKIDPVFSESNLSSLNRHTETMVNRWLKEKAGLKYSVDPYNSSGFTVLSEQICLVDKEVLHGKSRAKAEKDCAGRQSADYPKEFRDLHESLATRVFYFKMFMDYETDKEFAKKASQMFAFRMGWEVKTFHIGNALSFVLVPVPMEGWAPRVLKAALGFAEGHEKIISMAKAALKVANPYECVWYPGGIVRDRKSKGYGPAYYEPDLMVRPDVGGSGGKIKCKEVPRKKTKAQYIKLVRKKASKPKFILAVTPIPKWEGWVENKNRYGELVSKSVVVHIYEKVLR